MMLASRDVLEWSTKCGCRGQSRTFPCYLSRSIMDFKQEYADLLLMICKIMGCLQAFLFEPQMFYFIDEVMEGKRMIDWAKIISHNLDEKLNNLRQTQFFYMSSYVIYSLARTGKFNGLPGKGPIGCRLGQLKFMSAIHSCTYIILLLSRKQATHSQCPSPDHCKEDFMLSCRRRL